MLDDIGSTIILVKVDFVSLSSNYQVEMIVGHIQGSGLRADRDVLHFFKEGSSRVVFKDKDRSLIFNCEFHVVVSDGAVLCLSGSTQNDFLVFFVLS